MPTRGDAFHFLEHEGPAEIGSDLGSMLYVGCRSDTKPWWAREFPRAMGITRLAVLDISAGNLRSAEEFTSELIHGDVRAHDDRYTGFGLVFWDEGPEHLPREEALEAIRWLAAYNDHVLISCPWGFQQQGSDPADPEFHHWGPEAADFESIGMTVRLFGESFPGGHGNLIAWT